MVLSAQSAARIELLIVAVTCYLIVRCLLAITACCRANTELTKLQIAKEQGKQ